MIKLSTLAKEHFLIKEGTVKNAKAFDRLAYLILKNLGDNLSTSRGWRQVGDLYRMVVCQNSMTTLPIDRMLERSPIISDPLYSFKKDLEQVSDRTTEDFFSSLFDENKGGGLVIGLTYPEKVYYDAAYVYNQGMIELTLNSPLVMGLLSSKFKSTCRSLESFTQGVKNMLLHPEIQRSIVEELQHVYDDFRITPPTGRGENVGGLDRNVSTKKASQYEKALAKSQDESLPEKTREKYHKLQLGLVYDFPHEIWARTQQAIQDMSKLDDDTLLQLHTSQSQRHDYFNDTFLNTVYAFIYTGPKYRRSKEIPEKLKKRLSKVYIQALGDILQDRDLTP